jgi:hypothetical protein
VDEEWGPLWSPVGGEGIVFLQEGSQGNRTRATTRVPSPLSPTPAPTEFDGLLIRVMRMRADQAAVGVVNRVHDKSAPTAYLSG